jgi:hypothetical protein
MCSSNPHIFGSFSRRLKHNGYEIDLDDSNYSSTSAHSPRGSVAKTRTKGVVQQARKIIATEAIASQTNLLAKDHIATFFEMALWIDRTVCVHLRIVGFTIGTCAIKLGMAPDTPTTRFVDHVSHSSFNTDACTVWIKMSYIPSQ